MEFSNHLISRSARLSGPALFTVVSVAGPFIAIITGTITARWLTPEEFGAIQTGLLLSPYLSVLGFGIYHGLNRNYPYLIGKGKPDRALDMVGASMWATRWISLLTLLLATFYAIFVSVRTSGPILAFAVWAAIPVVCVYPLATHYEVLYRTRDDFTRFAWIQAIGYVISLVTLILVYMFRFYGQCIRLEANAILNLLLRWVWRPLKSSPDGRWADVKGLARTGFPLLAVGYLLGIFAVADRSVVALKLGPEAVGFYSLSGIVIASMAAFPMAIAQVILPRASANYGATGSSREVRRWIWMLVLPSLAVLIPVAIIGWWLLPTVVVWLLPRYMPGVDAARLGLIAGAIGAPGIGTVFAVLQRNALYAGIIAAATVMVWVLSLLALGQGGNLVAVAWVRIAATALLSGSAVAYAIYLTR